jgi:hypothetical protein
MESHPTMTTPNRDSNPSTDSHPEPPSNPETRPDSEKDWGDHLERIFRGIKGVYVDEMDMGLYHISFAVEIDEGLGTDEEGSSYGGHLYVDVNDDILDFRLLKENVDHEVGGHSKPCDEVPEPYRGRLRTLYWEKVASPLLAALPDGVEARVNFPTLKCAEYTLRIRLSAPETISEEDQEALEAVAVHGTVGDALRTKVGGLRTCEAEVIEV